MKRFELEFIDGPGAGRSIESDKCPKAIWLCNVAGTRWWTLKEPEDKHLVEVRYKILGHILLDDERYRIMYGEERDEPTKR